MILRRIAGASLLLALAAGLAMLGPHSGEPGRDPAQAIEALKRRDDLIILFVLIDTLRADRLGVYGYQRETSPNLDRLAQQGIRFARTVSQSSWTKSSMASLWTSTYPVRNGVLRYSHGVPPTLAMPAEILSQSGYRAVGLFRNGWVAPNFGFDRGFDVYHQPSGAPDTRNPSAARLPGTDMDLVESASELLRGIRDGERLFLYLHLMDVHQYVYDVSVADFGPTYSDIYDSAIGWVDHCVGELLKEVAQLGLSDRTLVVVGSDHGEGFAEHGIEGHARTLYHEVTEVPWILRLPTPLAPGIVVEETVQNVDIWPTVLDLLDLPPLPSAQGRSQLQRILSRSAPEPEARVAYSQLDRSWGQVEREPMPMVAVIRGDYRLVYHDYGRRRVELFDRASDPSEKHNLAAKDPDLKRSLVESASTYLAGATAAPETPTRVELDRLQLGQLRALGYVLQPGELAPGRDETAPEGN